MGWRLWIVIGGVLGALAVALGAFGAHALKGRLTGEELQWFDLATRYHLNHALALVAVGLVAVRIESSILAAAGWAFVAGILLFSGSLYAMALGQPRWLGMVTPIGGLGFIAGWLALAYAAFSPN